MRWLELDGRPAFVLGANPLAADRAGYARRFSAAESAGERLVRLHVRFGLQPPTAPPGQLDPAWADAWDEVLRDAEGYRLRAIVVFDDWAAWSEDVADSPWEGWARNPMNAANGGPAERPAELFEDSEAQRVYVARVEALARRWSARPNVAAWELFSELDLVSGARERGDAEIVAFVERAAAAVRAADPARRPITVSVSGAEVLPRWTRWRDGIRSWDAVWRSPAVDWVQVHPYPGVAGGHDLMRALVELAPRFARFGKPVLIGEAGLASLPPREAPYEDPLLDARPRAAVGYRQAAWAALFAGYANGGMFWWLSGFGAPDPEPRHGELTAPVARFAAGLDGRELHRARVRAPAQVRALALAGPDRVVGYVRDERCVAPDWPSEPVPPTRIWIGAGADVPAGAEVELLHAVTLAPLGRLPVERRGGGIGFTLPEFREDLVFDLRLR